MSVTDLGIKLHEWTRTAPVLHLRDIRVYAHASLHESFMLSPSFPGGSPFQTGALVASWGAGAVGSSVPPHPPVEAGDPTPMPRTSMEVGEAVANVSPAVATAAINEIAYFEDAYDHENNRDRLYVALDAAFDDVESQFSVEAT